ncbi:hypothetical protein ACHAXH_001946 [Discostella pseudostelligera]
MKLISAAIAFSTLATSQAASSSSAAISETKRLRNVNVYKSEKNGPAARDGQSFSDVRALKFLDIEVSLSLSASLSSDAATTPTTAPATGAPSSGAPTSDTPTTSMAPSAAPTIISSTAKGEETKAPSTTLAPSTAAPFPTIIETPIVTSESPISTSTQCTICEAGDIIDSELMISGLDVTCGQASEYALSVTAGEAECTQVVTAAKEVCCQTEFPSDIEVDGSISLDGTISFDYVPTITPIGEIGTTAPSPSSSPSPGTSSDEPSSPIPTAAPVGLLPASDTRNSAMMMSTMGGATCLIASLMAYVGLF